MKRIAGLAIITLMLALTVPAFAQDEEERGEFSVYADYMRFKFADTKNFWGPGASIAFNVHRNVQLEGGLSYLPEKTAVITEGTGTSTVTTSRGLRMIHGLFGPKFQTGVGPAKAYVVLKGGFLNFSVSRQGGVSGFTDVFGNIDDGDTNGVFYPGVGFVIGKRIGLRAEVGDLMYFDRGTHHNLRVQVGPTFRF